MFELHNTQNLSLISVVCACFGGFFLFVKLGLFKYHVEDRIICCSNYFAAAIRKHYVILLGEPDNANVYSPCPSKSPSVARTSYVGNKFDTIV